MTPDHPAIDAKREAFLLAGADVTGERHRFSFRAGGSGDSPHRSDFGSRLRLVAGIEESQAHAG
jgi:hypothetical protein